MISTLQALFYYLVPHLAARVAARQLHELQLPQKPGKNGLRYAPPPPPPPAVRITRAHTVAGQNWGWVGLHCSRLKQRHRREVVTYDNVKALSPRSTSQDLELADPDTDR